MQVAAYQRPYAFANTSFCLHMNEVGGLPAVFMANRDVLHRFLRARLRGAGDAEDVLQDLWIKLESLETGPVAEPLAYIYRMAENLVLDRRRSAMRRTNRENEWTKGQIDESFGLAVDSEPDAERHLLARDHLRRVDGVLDGLPERTAFAFRSVRIQGVPQKEIAASMGISLSAVEKHLQRAYRAVLEIQIRLDAEDTPP
ncbi:RNA polymerase sigma factor [Sphingorhabdus sp.]|uniref:RNA polymerase sigma factor n=1 Tax=Sphingorhabdus sp. TaxID=1902408 RepID=UPI0039837586